ncbi:MAG: hypothetical protein IBX72_14710, partial [Nitrospirae bacterium]|nr:hypothetical protein [Nitrospirota bacterium]
SSTNVYKKVKKRLLKSNLQKKKEKRKEDVSLSQEKDTRIKTLVDYFFTICREREEEPEKVLPKDCALLKTRLGQYTEEQIKFMLDFYLKSEKARNNGLSIAVALSNHSIGEYSNKGRWFYEG